MCWRITITAILFSLPAVYSIPACGSPFDREIPSDALMYWGYERTVDPTAGFSNYRQAIDQWSSLMGDVLEWRVLKGELDALAQKSGVSEGFTILSSEPRCFALYPLIEGIPIPGLGLYVSQVGDVAKAERFLTGLLEEIASLMPSVRVTKDEYYGYWIHSVYSLLTLPGLDFSFTFKDSVLFLSNSKSLLLRAIDLWEEERGFLAENEIYQKAMAQLPEDRANTFYANLSKIGASGGAFIKNLQALNQISQFGNELDEIIPLLSGVSELLNTFESYASTLALDSDGRLVSTANTKLNLVLENETVKSLLNREPIAFPYERYLPRKAGTVSAGNILGPKDIWMLIKTFLPKYPPVQHVMETLHEWEEESGFSLEKDLFGWMGDSWCLLRPVMDLESVIATNQGALFLEVTDPEAAQNGLKKLVDLIVETYQIPMVQETETYLNTTITSLTLPLPLIPVAPSWCIHEKTLMITTRPAMIREMLDINAGVRGGIDRNRQYAALKDVAVQPANKVSIQDNESEFYAFREAMRKVGSIPEFANGLPEEFRALPGFILDRGAYLMSCWQTRRGTVKRISFRGDRIVSEKTILYGDLRAVPPVDSILRQKISLGAKDFIAWWADYSQQKGNMERALRLYTLLVDYFPDQGGYLSRLSDLYASLGKPEEAKAVYDRILGQNPETAYVIGRERLFGSASLEEIVERVQEMTAKTQRIRADAALFGIALMKRDAGDKQTAAALFGRVAQSPEAASGFVQAAAREAALLDGQTSEGLLDVPFTPTPPPIDGTMEENLWNRAPILSFQPNGDGNSAVLRLLRDESHLYVLVTGTGAEKPNRIQILFGPQRDYTHFAELTLTAKSGNEMGPALDWRVLDSYRMALDTGRTFSPHNLIPGNFSDIVKIIEQIIHEGDVEDGDLSLAFSSGKRIPHAWKIGDENSNGGDCLEVGIPWDAILDGSPGEKPVWLFNGIRAVESPNGETIQSLSGGDPHDPFLFGSIRVR